MFVEIKPSVPAGVIVAPPSKSMAHRLLICAGLAEGESIIENVSFSQDILATLDCLEALGATVKKEGSTVYIKGVNPAKSAGAVFPCRESGSTLRFLMPVAMLSKGESTFKGYGRLMERPLEVYEKIAGENGLSYLKDDKGITLAGVLKGGEYRIRGDISSQFVSGLMFALPLAENDSRILLVGKAESLSYVEMTVEALKSFGVEIKKENNNEYFVKGSQKYKAQKLSVEGDFSNAAFLDAFNLIGGSITVEGLKKDSLQGDQIYKEYFALLRQGYAELDVSDCPDLAPVLMTLAAQLNGAKLVGTRRLKIKESDRGEVMKEELSKFGAVIETDENEIVIKKAKLHKPLTRLYGHNDHRVVMSLAVLCSLYGGVIDGSGAIKKSYPDFFDVMKKAGLEVTEYDDK